MLSAIWKMFLFYSDIVSSMKEICRRERAGLWSQQFFTLPWVLFSIEVLGLGYCSSFFLFIHSGILSCHAIGAIQLKDTKNSWKCLKGKPGCSSTRTVCLVLHNLENSNSSDKSFSVQILRKCVPMGYKWNADDSFLATDSRRSMPHGYLWSDTIWFLPAQHYSYLPRSVSITCASSDRCTAKTARETWHLFLGFKIQFSKTFESHSSSRSQLILTNENADSACLNITKLRVSRVSHLLATALRKCLWSKKYQAQRLSWKPVEISWIVTSASLAILTSLIALENQKETTSRKECSNKHRRWHSKNQVPPCSKDTEIPNPEA